MVPQTYKELASVHLVSVTPNALDLLLKTKNTRLKNDDDVHMWSYGRKMDELSYMRDTIKSSWEFVDYTFLIKGVTRAFTHQLVRTRAASYAQQSQRTVDVSDQPISAPESIIGVYPSTWGHAVEEALSAYECFAANLPMQDARAILPTNMTTEIFVKLSLRTMHEMALIRLCTRTQGEYQHVFRLMRNLAIVAHPWAADFIQPNCIATGCCAFPRYGAKECNFYDKRMDHSEVIADTAKRFWSEEMQEAVPVADAGKAQ